MRREQFIPDTVWVWGDEGWMVPLCREDDPEQWKQLCERDDAVVTQVDDGVTDRGLLASSSSTAPSLMQKMIDILDTEQGMTVLEIGAGTGYNAAMLAEIVGAENIATVEIDADVADHARRALQKAGFPVTVVTGDGTAGYPQGAPFDRVVVTAGVQQVPYAWVAQTVPGGRILLPWASALCHGGVLVMLTVGDDGTAQGRFGRGVAFMRLRGQRIEHVSWVEDDEDGDYDQTTTRHDPREVFEIGSAARFAVGAGLAGLTDGRTKNKDGSHTWRLSHYESGSWAAFTPGSSEHVVRQHGPRRLWDDLEAAHAWWIEVGRPEPTRFGMTVTPEGQHIWLDSPDNPWSLA